ncbi:MAG: low-specificity L-threonine aldolase [Proteobacteria bacterium]|nr:low-specificity L-threonine aldolase [Pseudomonadota bacterium]
MTDAIDLRSDTVTRPTAGMREAMFKAPVGDDVFGEDPSVNALQDMAADILGREAALFVPSGTMANQIAIKVQTRPGDEVIVEAHAHPFNSESGAGAVISGVQFQTIPGRRGLLDPDRIRPALRPDDPHFPPSRLVCIENTHNRGGGSVYPLDCVASIRDVCQTAGLALHMDGARLFNACEASGVEPRRYAELCDTVSFCLSKGLGAPVGSLLVGDRDLIHEARRWRKLLGGGMRQAGILAAAGLYALEHHVERLAEDHRNAKTLATGLASLEGLAIDLNEVETNIVIFQVVRPDMDAYSLFERLWREGVLVLPFGPDRVRAVTHLDVSPADIEQALAVFARVLGE